MAQVRIRASLYNLRRKTGLVSGHRFSDAGVVYFHAPLGAAAVCFFLCPAVEKLSHFGSRTMPVTAFDRVQGSFAQQQFMQTLGATLVSVKPGAVEITLPFRADLTQQNDFLHAGVITSILDSACGYAALTVAPENANVLSVEFKLNLLSPAVGKRFVARAHVKRVGRRITVCTADAFAIDGAEEKLAATMLATIITVNAGSVENSPHK
jgi:uncharacterized protein (TIGR00369 family)